MTSASNPKAYLGVGWAFPIKPVGGRLAFSYYEDDVEQAIQIILTTEPGERQMLPDFGAGLRRFVFEPSNGTTYRAIENVVQQSLTNWEPRINLESVAVSADSTEPNLLLIDIDFVIRATNTSYNRVYPFYLQQGGQ
jgi:phage baseplate assembly protein W